MTEQGVCVCVIFIFLPYNFLCFTRDFPPKVSILELGYQSILEEAVQERAL